MINGLKCFTHVALAIQDKGVYERTVDFYRGILGMGVIRRWGNPPKHITMLDMGNCVLEIILGASGSGEGAQPHFALETETKEDVDRLLALCLDAGCTLARPATDIHAFEDAEGGAKGAPITLRNAFCTGFAGESIEFLWQEA